MQNENKLRAWLKAQAEKPENKKAYAEYAAKKDQELVELVGKMLKGEITEETYENAE